MFAPVEGWSTAPPRPHCRLKRKVRLARGGYRGKAQGHEEPSCLPNAVLAGWGPARRRSPLRCPSSPRRRVRTHARAHTPARARALRRARQPGSAAESKHAPPRLGLLACGRRPPLSTLRKPLDGEVARHAGSARPGRPSPLGAADAAPRRESAQQAEVPGRGWRSAPGARPEAAAGCGRARGAAGRGGTPGPGSRGAAGTARRARRYLLARPAGGRADWRGSSRGALGVAAGDTLGCLEGAAGGGGRAAAVPPQTSAAGVTSCHRSHPGGTPHSFLTSFFHSSPHPSLVLPPAPRTRVPSALRRPVPATSLLFWDRSASAALSPPREGRSPGAARFLPQLPAAQLGPLFRVAGASAGTEGTGARGLHTRSRKDTKPGPFSLPPLSLPPPEAAQRLVVGLQDPEEPDGLRWFSVGHCEQYLQGT